MPAPIKTKFCLEEGLSIVVLSSWKLETFNILAKGLVKRVKSLKQFINRTHRYKNERYLTITTALMLMVLMNAGAQETANVQAGLWYPNNQTWL